ncbi:hypothetical protein BC629DRAFT_1543046 [Irpex lacteus]|nr:hypothetical protein BC629DRAFT_1543046 [Irpex lacteus]
MMAHAFTAYTSPLWTKQVSIHRKICLCCPHYVVYEGSTTVVGINIVALMMLIRIRALYGKRSWVIAFMGCCFCLELGVNAWLLSHAVPVAHQDGIHACSMVFDEGGAASAFAWSPLAYDTMIFALTLYKTVGPTRKKTAGKIAQVMLKDGTLYYSVILAVNLVLMIMLVAAPPGLQNLCSHLTVTMIRESDPLLRSAVKSASTTLPRFAHRVPVDIAQRSGTTTDLGDISVMVQESAVVHDDGGNIVRAYHDDSEDSGSTGVSSMDVERKDGSVGGHDWFELQVRPPGSGVVSHSEPRPRQCVGDEAVVHVV